MSEFIVLGLVPGTNTQLTFTFWLLVMLLLGLLVVVWKLWWSARARGWVVAAFILWATRRRLSLTAHTSGAILSA